MMATGNDDTETTSGGIIIVPGITETDITSTLHYLSKVKKIVGIYVHELAYAMLECQTTPTKQIDLIKSKISNENIIIKKKAYCYFLPFVLFLVAFKGILPHPCRDIRNDETPYGFG